MINPWLNTIVLWIPILTSISWVGCMLFMAFILVPYVCSTVPLEDYPALMAASLRLF